MLLLKTTGQEIGGMQKIIKVVLVVLLHLIMSVVAVVAAGSNNNYKLKVLKPSTYYPLNQTVPMPQVCISVDLVNNNENIQEDLRQAFFSKIIWHPIIVSSYDPESRHFQRVCEQIVLPYRYNNNDNDGIITSADAGDNHVCLRIDGCSININAKTLEEYCPDCVWKNVVVVVDSLKK